MTEKKKFKELQMVGLIYCLVLQIIKLNNSSTEKCNCTFINILFFTVGFNIESLKNKRSNYFHGKNY